MELAHWLQQHEVRAAFSGYRCTPVRIGVPVADGLLCTEPLHGPYEWNSDEWKLWRCHEGRLSLVWHGRRNGLALQIEPGGERFSLTETRPGTCDTVNAEHIEKAELDNERQWKVDFALCLQRGWYVWNGQQFTRDSKQPACPPNDPRRASPPSCSEWVCAMEHLPPDCLPVAGKITGALFRGPDSPEPLSSLSDSELVGWLEVHNVHTAFSDHQCVAVQVGKPAADGLLCTAPPIGLHEENSEEWKLWRSNGDSVSLVWHGRRNYPGFVDLALEIHYSGEGFLLRETTRGACDRAYDKVSGDTSQRGIVRKLCLQRGRYVWNGKHFLREPRQRTCSPIRPDPFVASCE